MGYCQEENEKKETKKLSFWSNADELKATVKETSASIPPQQCHNLITENMEKVMCLIFH